MLVLAAPETEDPRDGGFVHTLAGELLYRPFACDAAEHGGCGCDRAWAGVGTSRAATIAEVVDKPHLTRESYLRTIGMFLAETWGWDSKAAVDEASDLAELATFYGVGALVTIDATGHDLLGAAHE